MASLFYVCTLYIDLCVKSISQHQFKQEYALFTVNLITLTAYIYFESSILPA